MKSRFVILFMSMFIIIILSACRKNGENINEIDGATIKALSNENILNKNNKPMVTNDSDLIKNKVNDAPNDKNETVTKQRANDNTDSDNDESKQVLASINGNRVNMRAEPLKTADIIKVLSKGQEILLLDSDDGWGYVFEDDVYGYVYMDFIKIVKNTTANNAADLEKDESQKLSSDLNIAWINELSVNLRSKPSREAAIIAVLKLGQEVTVYGDDGEWKHVLADGKKGYIYGKYIDEKPEEQAAQEEPRIYKHAAGSITIAIDPGHQGKGNNESEPIGPGAAESKPKVSWGTSGVSSKVPEYKLTLEVALKLRDELYARGYNVFMIRETNDVNISNKERAIMATEAGADIFIRIHADGSTNSSVNGILTLCPTKRNPYVPNLYLQSRALSEDILNEMVKATGAKNRGVSEVDNMSGINWSTMPVTIVEMGLMTNPAEDKLMQTDDYQQRLVKGIANGIELYFAD